MLTVTYSAPNPDYLPPPDDQWGYSRDKRLPHQVNEFTQTVLSVELTPDQWEQLKRDTLKAWASMQDGKQ